MLKIELNYGIVIIPEKCREWRNGLKVLVFTLEEAEKDLQDTYKFNKRSA